VSSQVDEATAAEPFATRRRLVLIGGLPGAGKTTLLSALLDDAPPHVVGVDSEQVTDRVRRAGVRGPYRLLRPAVHGWHRLRVRRAIAGSVPVVVVTDPLTSERRRRALLQAASDANRPVRLVLLDVDEDAAVEGQRRRRRVRGARSMARHVRRWDRFVRLVRRRASLPGVEEAVVLERGELARLRPERLLR
jgi:hypothetical protein